MENTMEFNYSVDKKIITTLHGEGQEVVLESVQKTVQDVANLEARVSILEELLPKILEQKERRTFTTEFPRYEDQPVLDRYGRVVE